MQRRFFSLGSAVALLLVVPSRTLLAFQTPPPPSRRVQRLPSRHSELRADSVRDYAAETSNNLVVGIPVSSVHKQRLLLGQQQQRQRYQPKVLLEQEQKTTTIADDTSAVPSLVINLVKSIVGGGALALPAAVSTLGDTCEQAIPAATLLIVLAGGLYAYYFSLLGQVCRWTGATTYSQAWEKTVGATAAAKGSSADTPPPRLAFDSQALVSVTVGLKTLLACIAYSMILGDSFQSLLWTAGWEHVTRTDAILAVTLTALLPLSLQTNLSKLAPFSAVGLLSFAVTVVAMMARFLDGSYSGSSTYTTDIIDGIDGTDIVVTTATASNYLADLPANLQPSFGDHHVGMLSSLLPDPSGIVLLCTCATAFVAHYNVPRFFSELPSDQKHRFDEAVQTSFGAATATYLIVALAGFATFGTAAQSFILNNYSPHDPLVAACRAAMTGCILFTFPLPFVGLRDTVLDIWHQSQPQQQHPRNGMEVNTDNNNDGLAQHGVSIALLAIITGVAASVDNLGLIMSVGGGTFSTAVAAVFPTLMFRAAVRQRRESQQLSSEEEQKEREQAKLALILMGMSTTIGLTGVAIALNHAFHWVGA